MSRSTKKGPYVDEKLMTRILKQKDGGERDPIRTWSRASVIAPEYVNHTVMVHNGKTFIKVFMTEDMVGHRLGEFAQTRTFRGHSGRRKEAAAAPGAPGAPGARAPAAGTTAPAAS